MSEIWTAKQVEEWLIEAAETLLKLPGGGSGQAIASGPWADYARDYGEIRIRSRPEPGAIDRMYRVWAWINRLPSESDRRLLYGWADTKARRGHKVEDFAAREGIKSRTLRWLVTRLCQSIADRLNGEAPDFHADPAIDGIAEILVREKPDSVDASRHRRSPTFTPPPDKPRLDTSPAGLKRLAREIDRSNKRLRKARKKSPPRG